MTPSQTRIDADHPIPMHSVCIGPGVLEMQINFVALANLRRRRMSWVKVMESMAEDYGVRVWRDNAGRTVVEVIVTTIEEPRW
jgi:hypothetical protein